jgi:nuclear pore complex protein Nup107
MSDRAIVSLFQSTDPDISESVVVKEWLERVANYETVELVNTETTSYLAATAAANQQQQQQKQVFHELDPDGPVRSNRPLDPEDVRIKGRLTRNLFELVRRGEMGKALDLCRSCNEHWRAASLAGGIYYNDPSMFTLLTI